MNPTESSLPAGEAAPTTGTDKLDAMTDAVATVDDLEAARRLMSAMCHGKYREWRMCIPVQPDDSDMIWSRVIATAARYVKLKPALDALETAVKPVEAIVADTERNAVTSWGVTEYVVPWVHLRPLLNAISTLLGVPHER